MARTATPFGGLLAAPRKALTVLKEKRGLSASLPEVLGAVGIGILLLGLVGFGIGAGINFAQDSGAKGALESVKSAQLLHQSKTNAFGSLEELTTADGTGAAALSVKPDNVTITVSADKRNYCALVVSGSMGHTPFWVTAKTGKIVDKEPTAAEAGVACPKPAS